MYPLLTFLISENQIRKRIFKVHYLFDFNINVKLNFARYQKIYFKIYFIFLQKISLN